MELSVAAQHIKPRPVAISHSHRRLALLGGTTTLADCAVALRLLAHPAALVEGPALRQSEEAFARQVKVRHAISFAAGRIRLYGVLRALGVGPGDELLLPAPTHIVVTNAVRYAGAGPVYVDCDLHTFTMDMKQAGQ